MAKAKKLKKEGRLLLTGAKASVPLDLTRPGMPALDSIVDDTTTFRPKAGGPTYRILKTTEVDSYEKTPTAKALQSVLLGNKAPNPHAVALAANTKPQPTPGGPDNFAGTARMAAKLSISTAKTENFSDVSSLIATLPPVATMAKLKISTAQSSNRVSQEQRNVHVAGFLYAASKEADNDFHMIVGLNPNAGKEMYMTMELSGLPPSSFPAFASLSAARQAFTSFFGAKNLPGAGYHFYQPPIKVQIDGSLFFDASHDTGQAPGPPSLKSRMPTIWEIHPVSKIKLG